MTGWSVRFSQFPPILGSIGSHLSVRTEPPLHQVHEPTAADVRAGATGVREHLFVLAAHLLQRIGQDRQALVSADLVDAGRQPDDRLRPPRGVEGDRAERVPGHVAELIAELTEVRVPPLAVSVVARGITLGAILFGTGLAPWGGRGKCAVIRDGFPMASAPTHPPAPHATSTTVLRPVRPTPVAERTHPVRHQSPRHPPVHRPGERPTHLRRPPHRPRLARRSRPRDPAQTSPRRTGPTRHRPTRRPPVERAAVVGLLAIDGPLLPALPRMAWALWRDITHRAAKGARRLRRRVRHAGAGHRHRRQRVGTGRTPADGQARRVPRHGSRARRVRPAAGVGCCSSSVCRTTP